MNKENDEFDFQKALKAFQEGQPLTGGVLGSGQWCIVVYWGRAKLTYMKY